MVAGQMPEQSAVKVQEVPEGHIIDVAEVLFPARPLVMVPGGTARIARSRLTVAAMARQRTTAKRILTQRYCRFDSVATTGGS